MKNLSEILEPEHIMLGVRATDMDGCLADLTRELVQQGLISGAQGEALDQALVNREHLAATCVGRGVAIPHAYLKELGGPMVFFARLEHSFDYDAPDGEPVDLVFLLTGPEAGPAEHLKTLAHIVRLVQDRKLLAELRQASTPEEVHRAIEEVEHRHA